MKLNYTNIIKNQPIYNFGVIGHVAHGKSTFVRSITGIRTQRHSNEQERNITIEIGYANTKILPFLQPYNLQKCILHIIYIHLVCTYIVTF